MTCEFKTKVCAICGAPSPDGRQLHVDHNHDTGEVRGLLCLKYNNALGSANDDPDLLRKMIDYLEKRNG